jgi:hypothetical protein
MARGQKDDPSSEADRHKRAALNALSLLDWCIEYLASHHQGRVAAQLALSRKRIAGLLRD